MMKRAIFLDRDGVINIDKDYVYKIKDLRLINGSSKALLLLQKKGFVLIIITNQSGIGRGLYREKDYFELRTALLKRLLKKGIKITKEYYCPHAPEKECACRKPRPYFLKMAEKEYDLDLSKSYFIGDKTADIIAGKNAGTKTILVLTGKAGKDGQYKASPDFICKNLLDAVKVVN